MNEDMCKVAAVAMLALSAARATPRSARRNRERRRAVKPTDHKVCT
jgi:hypothetical protein